MTVSMRVMSAGSGYRYLLKSVAVGDGDRALSTPLTRYYAEKGTPPGSWLGSGVSALGGGELSAGDVVTEGQLRRLLGEGRDPGTGVVLGRAYPKYSNAVGCGTLGQGAAGGTRRAVAGYDFTFSVPKSVSLMWALAAAPIQEEIVEAHHTAVSEVIDLMEREVAFTRAGASTANGAVAQVDVTGLIAVAYDHYDSRTADPQLHTHVVVSNKVRTVYDGKWRSLDGRPLHASTVALSEYYNGALADQLSRRLGVDWEQRNRGRDRNPAWEIVGVPERLIEAFSSRSRAIEIEKDRLVARYVAEKDRQPSTTTVIKLRAQATLATRPFKTPRSLLDLTDEWRTRAGTLLTSDPKDWARRLVRSEPSSGLLVAEDVGREVLEEVAARVLQAVGERRSTWKRWNLHAEASRQIMGWRFADAADRESVLEVIAGAAEAGSLRLTPPELAVSPESFRRSDGTSVFRPAHSPVFTSADLLAAEDRLLELSGTTTAPRIPSDQSSESKGSRAARGLSGDQLETVLGVAGSGRVVDVLGGAAGTGKTTAMLALRTAWESSYGPGSVVGLATSAAAAQVLADELGVNTENTAKWLHDHHRGAAGFQPNQLVIVDEASLAGTLTVDRIAQHSADVGAKVLLVGDWAQLAAVDAGGAFGMLVRDRRDVTELTDVHRFHNEWERAASLNLRIGDAADIDSYAAHDRLREGEYETMLDHAYQSWISDIAAGKSSLLVAESSETVTVLNTRARLDRIMAGHVTDDDPVHLHDGSEASQGDLVITRCNNRRLRLGRDWVKNGDRWTIVATNRDGSIQVRPAEKAHGATLTLPADYSAEHVELAYAVTAYRAQGVTVDTAHVVVQSSMTREGLYVAMTRGRRANTAYIVTDQPEDEHHLLDDKASGRSVLVGVLNHVGAELSAHETLESEHEQWAGIDQLAAEYETIAASAQHDRWANLIHESGLTCSQAETVIDSGAFGPLTVALRRAEAHRLDPAALLRRAVSAGQFVDTEDIASVLHFRVSQTLQARFRSGGSRDRSDLIAGLIPKARGPMTEQMRVALHEREDLIENRARALAETAVAECARWTDPLGSPPTSDPARREWLEELTVIAAYRDRYHVSSDTPIGPHSGSRTQRADLAIVSQAERRAKQFLRFSASDENPRQGVGHQMRLQL